MRPRLAELVAALSNATDLGTGMPMGHGIRSCLVALSLGRAIGLAQHDMVDLYYTTLLRMLGCTADSVEGAEYFGDEIAFGGDTQTLDYGDPAAFATWVMAHFAEAKPPEERAAMLAKLFSYTPDKRREYLAGHCEVAQLLAGRIGLGPRVRDALAFVFERHDGNGAPNRVAGESIPMIARIMNVAKEIETHHRIFGVEGAIAMARQRSGGAFDPRVVAAFLASAAAHCAAMDVPSPYDAVIAAEPGEPRILDDRSLDRASRAVAEFTDLKSPHLLGHSNRVAELAVAAARGCGLETAEIDELRIAAQVHDLGRVTVSAGIWEKGGALSDDEWEKVRLHSYYTERILARAKTLGRIGLVGGLHHERLDGSGYHRAVTGGAISAAGRILAAADAYAAMTEARAHRPALEPDQAAADLRAEVQHGRLDASAVNPVLAAAGHRGVAARAVRPAGLTDRELDVLRLVAEGLSMRDMAARLHVASKTVDTHLQHIYGKIGVSSRAAATMYALQHDLLRK